MNTATPRPAAAVGQAPGERCILVIFGAAGDLTKRLLMPALYNLACDGLLPAQFAIVGMARDELTTETFRSRMERDIRTFNTRKDFDAVAWAALASRLHYTPGEFGDPAAFSRLHDLVAQLDAQQQAGGNVLFYLATPPAVFGLISANLDKAGFKHSPGWKRLIVEKPFGVDLPSAQALNRDILSYWQESQVYRIDHYLGKETVQNILAFRFANGMFEPLWNKNQIDHIQLTVSESVSVEGRGGYYDRSGVLRDMIQNHMFQMLAYVCMEPPSSFAADDIRDEKAKLLKAVRVYTPSQARENAVRGQYGAGKKADGAACPAYRHEPDVNPLSNTETFAALRLFIDNWRWDGVPIYPRAPANRSGRKWDQRRRPIQEAGTRPLSRHGGQPALGQSVDLPHPARSGDRNALPGEDPRPRHAAPTGQHALQLRRGLPCRARHRLRGDALQAAMTAIRPSSHAPISSKRPGAGRSSHSWTPGPRSRRPISPITPPARGGPAPPMT